MPVIDCHWCAEQHGDLLLCAPAKRILDALYARGMELNMPTIEFPEPVHGAGMFGDGTVLVSQLVVKAAVVPVAGVHQPTLIFTGLDAGRRPLPSWVVPADEEGIGAVVKLVSDTGDMAVRGARKARREAS